MANQIKKQIAFTLGKIRTMKQVGGKGFRSWLFVLEDDEGNIYKTFHPIGNPLMLSDDCIITGTFHKEENYLGEKQIVFKNAKATNPPKDTEEVEAEAMGDNIDLHRQENPYWWVIEGREDIVEEEVCFGVCLAQPALSREDREHAEAEAAELPPFSTRGWAEFVNHTENR